MVIRLDSIDEITKARKRIVIRLANKSSTNIFFAQAILTFKHDLQNIKSFLNRDFQNDFLL